MRAAIAAACLTCEAPSVDVSHRVELATAGLESWLWHRPRPEASTLPSWVGAVSQMGRLRSAVAVSDLQIRRTGQVVQDRPLWAIIRGESCVLDFTIPSTSRWVVTGVELVCYQLGNWTVYGR